ncbi:hypothetical protein VB713_00100 [Anabaena cylindrica UHCC 0172]|uniref:hypothetical protein n=1 Tax=Anabaena cylindrica TaxID=1165 RepID=UPI002B1EB906|nr:hypothetical protein [Anabaena cylindrica]MEA5549393.1 hypothetical protein [Anabaena cylindrica UHCC 0172]
MLESKKEISNFQNQKRNYVLRLFTVPVVAIAGLLTSVIPSIAVTDSYRNDYRVCAAQLLSVGVTTQSASQGCATALRPKELSSCVAQIKKQTEIASTDALYSCSKARRPQELAACVVGISKSTQKAIDPTTLTYCGRSLLPVTFAQCVVGLRKEIDFTPIQSLNTCINASDRIISIGEGSTTAPGLSPGLETTPMPSTPSGSGI